MNSLDLLLIHPGGRGQIYQNLGGELSVVEPPLWCRLIAGYALDRGYFVEILDSEVSPEIILVYERSFYEARYGQSGLHEVSTFGI